MSGYLAHLVSRTLGLGAPLVPLRKSPFEPAAEADNAGIWEGATDEPCTDAAEISHPLPRALVPERVRTAEPDGNAAQGGAGARSRITRPSPDAAARFEEVVALAETGSPAELRGRRVGALGRAPAEAGDDGLANTLMHEPESSSRAMPNARHASDVAVAPPVVARALEQTTLERGVISSQADSSRAAARTALTSPTTSLARKRDSRPGRRDPAAEVAEAPPRRETPSQAVDMLAKPRMILAPASRALPPVGLRGRAAERRAPDVHISIGSVEIRAQQTASRAQPKTASVRALRPTLSLDAYLTKRRGRST
ncbi:MAG TPA: hypothetical protein VFS58_01300 [Steroidobacteraceae bacterium]|nr:hypothetical protein [Steroidobacteraceae bacterium]